MHTKEAQKGRPTLFPDTKLFKGVKDSIQSRPQLSNFEQNKNLDFFVNTWMHHPAKKKNLVGSCTMSMVVVAFASQYCWLWIVYILCI